MPPTHTLATGLVSLVNRLDDTNSNRLPHVTNGETTERGILVVGFHTHGLARHKLGNASIARLDKLRVRLDRFTSSAIDLFDELGEFTSNVSSVAIEHGGVTGTDLTGVVKDDDLGVERGGLLRGVVLGVGSDVTTADILDRNVPTQT